MNDTEKYKPKFCKDISPEKIEQLLQFLEASRKRLADLKEKELRFGGISKAESYEIEMCVYDIKRAVEILK